MRKLANYQFTTWRIPVHVTTIVLGDPRTLGRAVLKNERRVVNTRVQLSLPCETICCHCAIDEEIVVTATFTSQFFHPLSLLSTVSFEILTCTTLTQHHGQAG